MSELTDTLKSVVTSMEAAGDTHHADAVRMSVREIERLRALTWSMGAELESLRSQILHLQRMDR